MEFCFKTEPITTSYKITSTDLGIGASGNIKVCEHIATRKKYAIKILPDDQKSRQEIEIHKIANNHPNIAELYEVYQNTWNGEKSLLLIMELLNGGELFERIQSRKVSTFTEREASNIIHSICSAVNHLHTKNIAHRDIKPENLIYSERGNDGIIKLIDFGFARRIDSNSDSYSSTPVYTPYYSSPESLSCGSYDKSCDVWAIGVIIYILLSGYPPFSSTSGKPISPGMKERIKAGKYNLTGPEWNRVSEAAKDLIRRCLKPDPVERITIDEIMNHKWIIYYNKNPITPLRTTEKFKENSNLLELSDGMEHALASMRSDVSDVKLKSIGEAKNALIEKRKSMQRSCSYGSN